MTMEPEARTLSEEDSARVHAAADAFIAVLQDMAKIVSPRERPRERLQIVLSVGFQSVFERAMVAYRPDDDAPDAYHAAMFETGIIGLGLAVGNVLSRVPAGPNRMAANRTIGEAVSSALDRADDEARAERIASVQPAPEKE